MAITMNATQQGAFRLLLTAIGVSAVGRDIRERKIGYERLGEIWETQQKEHADDWLLSMEIFEILDETGQQNALKQHVMTFLNHRKTMDRDNATLIEWGFRLVTYHKTNLETADQPR